MLQRPIWVLISMVSPLDREAYASRIGQEYGYDALLGAPNGVAPDVRLSDRCGGTLGVASSPPTIVLNNGAGVSSCSCCRQLSRGIDWPNLFGVLAEAAGRDPTPLDEAERLATLTRRERDVLRLVGHGKTVNECAAALGVSTSTVGNHKYRLMRKLGATTSLQLLRIAVKNGIADFE